MRRCKQHHASTCRGNKPLRRWVVFAFLACLVACLFTPLNAVFNKAFLVEHLPKFGRWSVCIFICAYIVLTAIGIPGTILAIAGGVVFGLLWGTVWSVVGATLGAIAAFLLARYLLHDWIARKFGNYRALQRFQQAVRQKPLPFILAVRFAPISPFNVVNFLFGLTPVPLETYAVGTLVGIIPGTLAYTWLGVAGKEALMDGDRVPLFLALGFLTFLSLLPLLARNKQASS